MNGFAYWFGVALRSVVLGALLFAAVVALLAAGGTEFRYQGY
jgi:hypothetical protein